MEKTEGNESIAYLKRKILSQEIEISIAYEKQKILAEKNTIISKKLRNMEAVFSANHREPLDVLVDNFISDGRVFLKKISGQVQLLEFDADNLLTLQKLIDYLKHVIIELEKMKEQYK